jgi:hypothetical protein
MRIPQPRSGFQILILSFAGAICSFAASTYQVTLPSDVLIAETKVKSGDYTVVVDGKTAVFKKGKVSISIPVDIEKGPEKFSRTTLETDGMTLRVINLGGTNTMLVFRSPH